MLLLQGTIEKAEKDSYKVTGTIEWIDDSTIEITELPIRVWTQTYKELLESWVAGTEKVPALVKVRGQVDEVSAAAFEQSSSHFPFGLPQDYKEYHTHTTVHFIITLTGAGKDAIKKDGLEKAFKCVGKLSTSNMVMFDPHGKIKKYTTPEEVIEDFYDIRLDYYHKRKAFLVDELTNIHEKISNQARFITMIIKKELVISNRKRAVIVAELRAKNFRPFPKVQKAIVAGDVDEEEEVEDINAEGGLDSDFDYLLQMALSSLTAEKVGS